MAQTPTRLVATNLTTTLSTTLYTVGVGKTCIIKQIILCNADTVARTVTLGAAGFNLTFGLVVPPSGTTTLDLSLVLNAGEVLNGGASSGGIVAILASGVVSP